MSVKIMILALFLGNRGPTRVRLQECLSRAVLEIRRSEPSNISIV